MDRPDPGCLFCRIIGGEIPAAKVLETDHAVAFLDIHPVNLGHVLLVPKVHHATLADLDSELAAATATLLPRLGRAILAVTGADGLNVVINNGRVAGQTIDHGHWHLIPRFEGDAVHWPWPHQSYPDQELGRMQAGISHAFASDAG